MQGLEYGQKKEADKRPLFCRFKNRNFSFILRKTENPTIFLRAWTQFPVRPETAIPEMPKGAR